MWSDVITYYPSWMKLKSTHWIPSSNKKEVIALPKLVSCEACEPQIKVFHLKNRSPWGQRIQRNSAVLKMPWISLLNCAAVCTMIGISVHCQLPLLNSAIFSQEFFKHAPIMYYMSWWWEYQRLSASIAESAQLHIFQMMKPWLLTENHDHLIFS